MSVTKVNRVYGKNKDDASYIQLFQAIIQKKPTRMQTVLKNSRLSKVDLTLALATAVELDNPAAVKILLKNGADVLDVDAHGRIALHKARTAQMVKLLLKEKAKEQILAKDKDGRTPVEHMNRTGRQSEAMAALIKANPKLVSPLLERPTTDCLKIEYPAAFFNKVSFAKGYRK